MLFRSKALLCVLSLYAHESVNGEGLEDDSARLLKRNGRKREPFRSHAKIGQRSLPNFERRLPVFSEDAMLSQETNDSSKAVPADSKNRHLGFNDEKFWNDYLGPGKVSSMKPTSAPIKPTTSHPTYAPIPDGTTAPVPPPTYYPVNPTEAPACKPICKFFFLTIC